MGSERADTIANACLYILMFNGVVCAPLCRLFAGRKSRSKRFWLFLGIFLGPLALIAAAGMPIKRRQVEGSDSMRPIDQSVPRMPDE